MKLLTAKVTNFGSYSELEFDFSGHGLSLISGPTGSGKSTLMDIPYWILFGETSKGGNVDEIKSWKSGGICTGELRCEMGGRVVYITRIRGTQKQNDLYWSDEGGAEQQRGKDLKETQELLNALLSTDSDLYSIASYSQESSPSWTFFTATAKARREFFNRLTDLDFPNQLRSKIDNGRKDTSELLRSVDMESSILGGKLESLVQECGRAEQKYSAWEEEQEEIKKHLQEKSDKFEEAKFKEVDIRHEAVHKHLAEIESLSLSLSQLPPVCKSCGSPDDIYQRHSTRLIVAKSEIKFLMRELAAAEEQNNTYYDRLEHLPKTNPHSVTKLNRQIAQVREQVAMLKANQDMLQEQVSDISRLGDLAVSLRTELLQNAISSLEVATNRNLELYFDSEIRCQFTLEGEEQLKVVIHKSGYECSYRQLSKGQRQILRLSFTVAAMEAASNQAGTHFDTVFLDEPTDGCDQEMKVKAFRLLEDLATKHDSVFVIDHDQALKEMFEKKFEVELTGDESIIHES